MSTNIKINDLEFTIEDGTELVISSFGLITVRPLQMMTSNFPYTPVNIPVMPPYPNWQLPSTTIPIPPYTIWSNITGQVQTDPSF